MSNLFFLLLALTHTGKARAICQGELANRSSKSDDNSFGLRNVVSSGFMAIAVLIMEQKTEIKICKKREWGRKREGGKGGILYANCSCRCKSNCGNDFVVIWSFYAAIVAAVEVALAVVAVAVADAGTQVHISCHLQQSATGPIYICAHNTLNGFFEKRSPLFGIHL